MSRTQRITAVSIAPDAFAGMYHRPILGGGKGTATYVGRVVVELLESPTARSDAHQLALSSGAVDGDHATLIERVAAALPRRLALNSAPDPLAGFQGRPTISVETSGDTYVGRVMVELWDAGDGDDTRLLTYSADATNGVGATLLERVVVALPIRLAHVNTTRAFA